MSIDRITDWLKSHWSKATFVIFIGFLLAPAAQNAWTDYQKRRATEEQNERISQVHQGASLAGMMLWSAYKSCAQIGVLPVDACAKYKPTLLQEQVAPPIADMAVKQRVSYWTDCTAIYTSDYCTALLERSIRLSQMQDHNGRSE